MNRFRPAAAVAALVAILAACVSTAALANDEVLGRSLAATGAVVAAILGAAWLLKRLQGGGAARSGLMRTVAALPVGARERVVIVEVRDTWLVLGVTAHTVNVLQAVPRPEGHGTATAGPPVAFADLLPFGPGGARE
jgi:flagellar protein FliO/FliZ